MLRKKMTNREQQSAAKRELICEKALELFKQYGYEKTTLSDISQASGFSIGSLYNFFRTKESILLEISNKEGAFLFDFDHLEDKISDPYPHILNFLLEYSSHWEKLGVDLTQNIYKIFDKTHLNPESHRNNQIASIDTLATFLQAAQDAGTFDTELSAQESAEYFITIGRGLVYEWCLWGGSYGLTEKAARFLPRIIRTFIQ